MNKIILDNAIDQVKRLLAPMEGICLICYKKPAELGPDTCIDILDIPTEIGISVCRTCFDNILIAIGEISQEY
ncbi:MAG: hypothetical protein KKD44_00375 [Proteobacteria bacterium]|nr:hypothetical protein [Pseudomonadota bacterium]